MSGLIRSSVRAEPVEALSFFDPPGMKKGGTSTSSVRTEERRDLSFASGAARLAGLAGVLFGWSPEAFWRATPAELAALVRAVAAEEPAPADATTLARLRKAFPDG